MYLPGETPANKYGIPSSIKVVIEVTRPGIFVWFSKIPKTPSEPPSRAQIPSLEPIKTRPSIV